jgi:hypothetical protein
MEDTNVFTEEKSKVVTSPIKASRQSSLAPHSTKDGQKSVTSASAKFQKETEQIKDALAIAKDLLNQWPCRMSNGEMPQPLISTSGVVVIALPMAGHVIVNTVTSDGKHDFIVDGSPIVPDVTETDVTEFVTSEEK